MALHTETRDGFTINFYALPEETDPADQFDMGDEANREVLEGIASGRYDWFCAKVTASKAGVELGADYLGCCCHCGAADWWLEGGYREDMINEATSQALETLKRLAL